jgi:cyclophilin family peptidyl-prolyl cis-trans isomerase
MNLKFILLIMIIAGLIPLKLLAQNTKKTVPAQMKNFRVEFETTKGNFEVELFSNVPITTQNFVHLVSKGFYNGLIFQRYVPGFVIQGGDPTGTGMGGSGHTIPLEITAHKNVKGALGMARTSNPDSASSQFYICLANAPFLNGHYAVFGKVIHGMRVVMKLRKDDKMLKVFLISSSRDHD